MPKKFIIPVMIFSVIAFFLLSCSNSDNPAGRLEGTWTVTTTPGSGPNYDGTFEITYVQDLPLGNITLYLYQGTGTLGGQSFYIVVNESVPAFMGYNFFYDFRDSPIDDTHMLYSSGTCSASTANGDYVGQGNYAGEYGTYTAVKQ
jgi:hypothetical protein